MTTARLYISHRCIFCRILEPGVRFWFWRHGYALRVYKVRDGYGFRVGAPGVVEAGHVPAVPALEVGRVLMVGFGILKALRALRRGFRMGGIANGIGSLAQGAWHGIESGAQDVQHFLGLYNDPSANTAQQHANNYYSSGQSAIDGAQKAQQAAQANAQLPQWQQGVDNFLTTNPLGQAVAPVLSGGAGYSTNGGFHAGMSAPAPAPVSNSTLNNTINSAVNTYHANNRTPPITYPNQPIANPQANNPGYHLIGDVGPSTYHPPATYAPGASAPGQGYNLNSTTLSGSSAPAAPAAPSMTNPGTSPSSPAGSSGQAGGNGALDTSAAGLLAQLTKSAQDQQAQRDAVYKQLTASSNPDYSSPAFQAQLNQARDNMSNAFAQQQAGLANNLAERGLGGGELAGAMSGLASGQNAAMGGALNNVYENERQRAMQAQGQLAGLLGFTNPTAGYAQGANIAAQQQMYNDQGAGGTLAGLLGLGGEVGAATAPYWGPMLGSLILG